MHRTHNAQPHLNTTFAFCESRLGINPLDRVTVLMYFALSMTEVLTVRLPAGLLAKIDERAAQQGCRRSDYVRRLIAKDAEKPFRAISRHFACLHLKGRYALGHGGNNAAVRAALARRVYKNRDDKKEI